MTRPSYLLFDTCVILDFIRADCELFSLVSQWIGQVFVARQLLKEIEDEIDVESVDDLGLKIVEANIDDVSEIANRSNDVQNVKDKWGRLSNYDALCLLTARRFNYVCVTNDRFLRELCEREKVEVRWGLQVVYELFTKGAITRERALKIGERVYKTNNWISKSVIDNFYEKINSFDSGQL